MSATVVACVVAPPLCSFGRKPLPNIQNRRCVTDAERLYDIEQKLRCWGYLSHHPDAERDMTWLLERLAEQSKLAMELEARLEQSVWTSSFP